MGVFLHEFIDNPCTMIVIPPFFSFIRGLLFFFLWRSGRNLLVIVVRLFSLFKIGFGTEREKTWG